MMHWTTFSFVLISQVNAFVPSSFLTQSQQYVSTVPSLQSSTPFQRKTHPTQETSSRLYSELEGSCLLTPEGYGFSSSMERVLAKAKRGSGFYTAMKDARVIDVMGGITEGQLDAALVYDQNELLGIFTESDYIKVSL